MVPASTRETLGNWLKREYSIATIGAVDKVSFNNSTRLALLE
tara:strand:+ start:76 stop:201 length:126 start_codon:yes stop_codon:yes gene_type:complete